MKKIIASTVGLMLAGGIVATTASAALENQFGGYWRTRFTFEDNMTGQDTSSKFYVDQRTRLFYTAKFSDDFKFVNKLEWNSTWGDATKTQTVTVDGVSYDVSSAGLGSGGDVGADGKGNLRLKASYADFNVGPMMNAKVGIQYGEIARGFLFADDFSGAIVTGKFGNVTVPLVFVDVQEEDSRTWDVATTAKQDQRIYAVLAAVKINDGMSVTPYFVYNTINNSETIDDSDNWYIGADADLKFGSVSVWATGIYEGGDVGGVDNVAFLGAAGVDASVASTTSVHGQFFYASGDDDLADDENNAFVNPPGRSYYWAEIMGFGTFDNVGSAGSPTDGITNVWAGNGGVTIKPMDKLKVTADVWYASLVEDNAAGDTELGLEFDGKVSYNIYDNLTADAIFAYLVSGDATGDEDVMEGGVQLSLKF